VEEPPQANYEITRERPGEIETLTAPTSPPVPRQKCFLSRPLLAIAPKSSGAHLSAFSRRVGSQLRVRAMSSTPAVPRVDLLSAAAVRGGRVKHFSNLGDLARRKAAELCVLMD
jgi:hypothetical protein